MSRYSTRASSLPIAISERDLLLSLRFSSRVVFLRRWIWLQLVSVGHTHFSSGLIHIHTHIVKLAITGCLKKMDLVSTCKEILACFRVKELKDVLMKLGLSTQGKKQDLVDRILDLLSNEVSNVHGLAKKNFIEKEGVAEIIDDVYRKLQGAGTTSASTNGDSFLEIDNMKPKEEVVEKEVRCPCCWSQPIKGNMIQCVDPQCRVLQHISCVIIPEQCSEGIPSQFYCEICRINRADPFLVTVKQPLSPVKLITSNISTEAISPHYVEKAFDLVSEDMDLLQNKEYDVQVWCIHLNDKVPFRMQWPLYTNLQVNGVQVKTFKRPESQLLGANGRDDGPMIASYVRKGTNQISLSVRDARRFCLGVRLVKKRTIEQILNLILEKQNCEPFEDALARVCRCIGGGVAMENEDSDSDLEVIVDCVTVNLRCPLSGSRIEIAARFRPCAHMGCFDLETFLQLNQLSRKWQCPICMKNYSLEDITIDPYFNHITKMVKYCGDDTIEIDVKPDGSWRAKNVYQFKKLEQWHLPDEIIYVSTPEDGSTCVSMIELDGIGNFNLSANNGHEINTVPNNFDATTGTMNRYTCPSLGGLDVIVLSDSEEENANFTYPETASITQAMKNGGHSFSVPSGTSNVYPEDPALDHGNDIEIYDQAFASDPPQLFILPTQPPCMSVQCDLGNKPQTSNGFRGENLTSFGLGSNSSGGNNGATSNQLDLVNQFESDEALSPPPGMNDEVKSNGTIRCYAAVTPPGLDFVCFAHSFLPLAALSPPGMNDEVKSNGTIRCYSLSPPPALSPPGMNDEVKSSGTTDAKTSSGLFSYHCWPRTGRHP
ncbi:E3 SUMO-protein ligase SIZ1-like isoform X15 [Camellia sinensis]|uniref:E3 SUMO-protein ligase SIZ1-like isoform X15 n=1 Tax=Camellia sinensis TaxID=4442 RepID=UPI0010357613|nr:E3 SUMO-protein ligase SIZ1-like isoform X15 [Camellia sinensis]